MGLQLISTSIIAVAGVAEREASGTGASQGVRRVSAPGERSEE